MKQEEPILVAIHCLVYNHEPYLRDCFEGFVMQKTNFRFVAIVHDDASTDKSAYIIREYVEKYPDIFKPIYEIENQYSKHDGSLDKVILPIIISTGCKYLAICEGDDYWIDPYKLQKQVDYMESHPDCSCYAHNSLTFNTNTGGIGLFNKRMFDSFNYPLEKFLINGWFSPTQSLMYRRSCFQYFNDLPAFMHGDYSLLINILLKPNTYLHYDNQIMSVYRDGGWASSNFKELDLYNDFIALLTYFKDKSNHRCDEIFEEQISRQQRGKEQYEQQLKEAAKTPSLFKRIKRWLRKQMK